MRACVHACVRVREGGREGKEEGSYIGWVGGREGGTIKKSKKLFHIDNQVQHIDRSNVERGKLKCNTYKTLSPFINYS